MSARVGVPAALLTPSGAELDDARARIGRLAGDSFGATYAALGIELSGLPGEAIRALRRGDLDGAGRLLRRMAAADLASREIRDQITDETTQARAEQARRVRNGGTL